MSDLYEVEELDYEEEIDIPSPGPAIGPQIPSGVSIGPALPPGFKLPATDEDEEEEDDEVPIIGPAIPNLDSPTTVRASIGPTLPPHLMNPGANESDEENIDEADLYGPAMPPRREEDEEEEQIGPLPPPNGMDQEKAAEEYALRRLAYEEEKESEKNTSKREEWMTSLPEKLTNYGLGARTFKRGIGGEKDSAWTDTPGQKKRKADPDSGLDDAVMRSRDVEQEKIAQQLNHNRNESLLDAHQKTRKVTAASTTAPGVRRPFDREKDMEVRGLKNASAEEIKQKCGNLGSRFGSGSSQKFL